VRAVIIGNSATAVGAVEAIREHDQSTEVVIVSEEPHGIYSRPLLDHYLAGEIDKVRLAYRPSDFYCRHSVRPLLNERVTAISPNERTIHTSAGQTLRYDRLLIATGGLPIVPPLEGLDAEGVFTFTRLDDALGVTRYIDEHGVRDAVVVGGGMIGIKATDALAKRGVRVSMVELAPRILSAALDETASRLIKSLLGAAGVEMHTENTIMTIDTAGGRVQGVTLRDGSYIPCQLLVFGIGVRPNASLAAEAGIKVNRGIVVDEYMRTSAPDVYAAGDVAEAYDLVVDMNRTVAIWPNAYRQGSIAGAHMVGHPRADQGGVAMNAIAVGDVPAISIGDGNAPEEGHEVHTQLDERHHTYKRLVLREGRLVGAILVGNISRAGIYTGLIRHRLDLTDCAKSLMSEQFGLLSLPTHYRKHVVTGAGIEV
jgi:NAD(P)H-nitrite reductase large subunit